MLLDGGMFEVFGRSICLIGYYRIGGKGTSVMGELAMRATIAYKLRKYNADEDTTISEFSLADNEKKTKANRKADAGK